ncbi:MAG: deoxyribodipyrimidine photo-lyase, partial [Gemmatimonadota bacterium]
MTQSDDLRLHAAGRITPSRGDFVLYWMQITLRATDNFALNYAIEQANRLRLPVLVYHGLRSDYPWASDRFHTFILESAGDLTREFSRRGIQYAFFLEHEPAVPKADWTPESRTNRIARSPL